MVKPMFRNSNSRNSLVLFAAVLAASVAGSNAFSQSSQGMQNSTAGPKKSSVAAAEPRLIDTKAGVRLVVPEVSNVGKMRQTSTPKPGMTYWMAFSNSGRPVNRGDRVDVVIGHFRVTGLAVE